MKNIWKQFGIILNRRQKIKVGVLVCMMVLGALLEMVGVGVIPSVLTVMMGTEDLLENYYIGYVCQIFHLQTRNELFCFLIGGLVLLYAFKGAYLLAMYNIQYKFVYNNRYHMQQNLMKLYLSFPYEYFLQASSGEIINQLTSNVEKTFEFLLAILHFLTESIIVLVLSLAIIFINPVMALGIVISLGLLMAMINHFLKPMMVKSGEDFQRGMALSNKWILQSISGIKELKVGKREQFFLDHYSKYGKMVTEAQRKSSFLGNVPRLAIETVSMCVILIILMVMASSGMDMVNFLPQLAAFAVAAIKILPGVNRMSSYRNSMAYYEPMLNKTADLLMETKGNLSKASFEEKGIEGKEPSMLIKTECGIDHVTFSYPDAKEPVLEDVSMVIPAGKSVGIVGVSGAGKSTVVDILLGLLNPQAGRVLINGKDILKNMDAWLSNIGYIPQMIYMLDDTIKRNVAFGCSDKEIEEARVWKALEEAELKEFVMGLPEGLETVIGERGIRLSGGQRQRIGIARALYQDPPMLIFDEATSALDSQTEADIIESMNGLHGKKTMVIIAHRLTTIENCDIVYRVENKKIVRER